MFENFRNKCIELDELDPAYFYFYFLLFFFVCLFVFFFAPGLAWQVCLKKTGVELELLTDTDVLLMVGKGIRGGIYHGIHRYAKANINYMKDYVKNIISSYLELYIISYHLHANNLYG